MNNVVLAVDAVHHLIGNLCHRRHILTKWFCCCINAHLCHNAFFMSGQIQVSPKFTPEIACIYVLNVI